MAIKRPYQMKTISSNLFVIDRKSYQRKKDKDKIAHIVSKWDERIANEPKISARDGKFYVFDGQHTILARESMNGEKPTEILCKVYKGMDAKEEARLFAMQTGFSSKLRSGEALRANLFGEEAEAVAFNAATEKVGIARACLDLPEILLNVLKASEH